MGARIRYPDLLDSIRITVENLEGFLSRLEGEAIGGRESLSITLGNYLRDATSKEPNPTIISNLGSVLSTIVRRMRISDTETISILRKTLSSFIERYVTESLSGLTKSCTTALSDSSSILLIPPGRLAEECVRVWAGRERAREVYVLSHSMLEDPPRRIGNIRTIPLPISSLSMVEDRVDTVVTEVEGIVHTSAAVPPAGSGAISYAKHVNNATVVGVTLSIAVKISGRPGETAHMRRIVEVPQAWGEFISVGAQDVASLKLFDKLVLGKHVIEGPPQRLSLMTKRIATSVVKDLTTFIQSAVVVDQSAKG